MSSSLPQLYLARHGDTVWTDSHQHTGRSDLPLNERGEAMKGDATDFAREDYVEAAWRIVGPVLGDVTPLSDYEPGTWGPRQAGPGLAPPGGWQDPVLEAEGGSCASKS